MLVENGFDSKLRSGDYSFGPGEVSYTDIKDELLKGTADKNTADVTIPEGYTVLQIAETFAKTGIVTKDDFLDTAASFDTEKI